MKIRVGYGLGTRTLTNTQEVFGSFVDDLERLEFDSLWVSERISGDAPDPVVAMSIAAGRTEKLKFGMSVMVLPGRNPVLVAKQMASLDRLSNGRLLPAFGLGAADPHEQQAFGVERGKRAAPFNEALGLMRRLWTEDRVTHEGTHYRFTDVTVRPKPIQQPLEIWLGGYAPSELRRCGRVGDGWLPSFVSPAEVVEGIAVINETAAEHDRAIDPEHMGALVTYMNDGDEIPAGLGAFIKGRRPDLEPSDVIVQAKSRLRERLEQFIEAGASKFVLIGFGEPANWTEELEEVASIVKPMENSLYPPGPLRTERHRCLPDGPWTELR